MSLITDTLNKMKKEQGSEENDDKMMAPPALRNAVINTKKYQEFVKNAEIKDINGHKAPLKGFVVVSIVLVAVIIAATLYFINQEDDTLIQQAGIVSNSQQPAQTVNNGNNVKSLGKPYNPNATVGQQASNTQAAEAVNKSAPAQAQTQAQNKATDKPVNAQPLNDMQARQTQAQMSSMPDSSKSVSSKKDNSNAQMQQGPVDIIPANQLFIVTPQAVPVNNQPVEKPVQKPAQNDNASPVENNMQNNKPAVEKQNVSSKEQAGSESKKSFTEISQEDLKKANEYTQKQVDEEKARAVKNAQAIQENYSVKNQNPALSKNSANDYTNKTEIAEVKAIKTKDPVGTVSASTISLYNQYVTTGNKAKNEGSYERAIEYYTNALALNKNDVLSANIANMYLELKNPNMAFQVVVRNGMTDAKLISALAVRMINSKYFLEGNKLLQYANTLEKSSYILFANGYYSQSQEQYDAAVKYYKDAMTANPADVSSAYYAALCYEEQGKNGEAVEMYQYILSNSSSPENMKKQASARIKKLGS